MKKLFWIAAAIGFSAGTAQAEFRVCNKAWETLYAAVGFQEYGQWVAEGWWELSPGECTVVIGGALTNRYYYVRGEGSDGTTWGGDFFFCTTPQRFKLADDANCAGGNMDREGFDQVDTGGSSSWTQNFTP